MKNKKLENYINTDEWRGNWDHLADLIDRRSNWGQHDNYLDELEYWPELEGDICEAHYVSDDISECIHYAADNAVIYYADAVKILAEHPYDAEQVMCEGYVDANDYSLAAHAYWVYYYTALQDVNEHDYTMAYALDCLGDILGEDPDDITDNELLVLAYYLDEHDAAGGKWGQAHEAAREAATVIEEERELTRWNLLQNSAFDI